ncbi:MAG: hypothetical protein ACPGD5_00450 [Salibacteraceae bacterium]
MDKNEVETKEEDENLNSKSSWLKQVAQQSWEPELLISGIAIYATSQIPGFLEAAYQTYSYDFQIDSDFATRGLPSIAFAAFSASVSILRFFFIFHFLIRAFWVGLIGLNSVYTKGIQYDRLENSDLYKIKIKKILGSKDEIPISIDRIASTLFSLAFSIAIMIAAIGFMYVVFFILLISLKSLLSAETYSSVSEVVSISISVLFSILGIVLIILNLKKFRNHPKVANLQFKLGYYVTGAIFPFVYKPITYVLLTFKSNISKTRFAVGMTIFFIVFTILLANSVIGLIPEVPEALQSRDFNSTRALNHKFKPSNYISLTKDKQPVTDAQIGQPVIDKRSLFLFIPYSKILDMKLSKYCQTTEYADSLSKYTVRKLKNENRIKCINDFFIVSIDGNKLGNNDFLFAKHPVTDQYGFSTYLYLEDSLKIGRHTINIDRRTIDDIDKEYNEIERPLRFTYQIPFWVQPD